MSTEGDLEVRDRADEAGPDGSHSGPGETVEAGDVGGARDWRHPSINSVVLLLLLAIGVKIGLEPLVDNSFLTHLATGRRILDSGSVPSVDPYSWTAHGDPWTVQSWGASVVYAGLDRTVGLLGIRVLDTALILAIIGLVWRLTRAADSLIPRVLAAGLVVCSGVTFWMERPLLFGTLFLVLVLLAADDALDPRWLVPVMWLWVNMHGSFPFGIGLLVLLAAGRWLDERRRPTVELRALAWVLVGTALAAVNPVGPRLLTFSVEMLSKRENFARVVEWKPPDWGTGMAQLFAVQLALTVLLVAFRYRRWRAVLPVAAFGVFAAMSMRNIAPASIVLAPIMASAFAGMGSIDGTRRPPLLRPVAGALVVLVLLLGVMGLAAPNTALEGYPEEASAWMRDEGLLTTESRVVSRDLVGNYLEYRYGAEEVRVFIDDRVDMYPLGVIRDYIVLIETDGDYQSVLERRGATAVLWDKDSPFGRWLGRTSRWRVVHTDPDDTWIVAVPAGS